MPKTTSPIYINTPQEGRTGRILFILLSICLLAIASVVYFSYFQKKPSVDNAAVLSLNEALVQSNGIIEDTNQRILNTIRRHSEAYQNDQGEETLAKAKETQKLVDDLSTFVEDLKGQVITTAGNALSEGSGPLNFSEVSSVASHMMLGTGNGFGKGYELMGLILKTREELVILMENAPAVAASIPLNIDQEAVWRSGKKDWVAYHFEEAPLGTMIALMTKLQNDAKASATIILNHLLAKIAGGYVKFDAFMPSVSATKNVVIPGDRFKAEIFLSAYSTAADENTKIYVDGDNLPLEKGKAVYETSASSIGAKQYNVRIERANPLTGEVEAYEKEFEYEVGQRSIMASAAKMNVFYIGVDNPLIISATGVSSNDLIVSISSGGGTIRRTGPSQYVVHVTNPGECRINVSGGNMQESKLFRVKRIPDPVARLSRSQGGAMSSSEFKAQGGVSAFLDDFDFDASCIIQGFRLTYITPGQAPVESVNAGARYTAYSRQLVNLAKPGDIYHFDDVKARCPGDLSARPINSMAFRIE